MEQVLFEGEIMARDFVNHYLSERSIEDLEASKGAQLMIHKPKIIESNSATIEGYQEELEIARQDVKSLEDALRGEEKFFKKVFGGKKAKAERDALQTQLKAARARVDRLVASIESLEESSKAIQKEIAEFYRELHNIGLRPQDIVEGYKQIKWEFAERERLAKEEKKFLEKKAEAERIAAERRAEEERRQAEKKALAAEKSAGTNKGTKREKLSPIEKFNRRMDTYNKKVAESNKPQQGEE